MEGDPILTSAVQEVQSWKTADRHPGWDFHPGLNESPGGEVLRLPGAPFPLRLEGLTGDSVANLKERWRTLKGEPAISEGETRLVVVNAGVERFLVRPPVDQRPEECRSGFASRDHEHLFWSYRFAIYFNEKSNQGKIAICRPESPYLEDAVENTLRVVFAWKALLMGGFLIHSAGIRRAGESYLFFGPSGSGKTTVSGLSPAADVLHDDLCLVVPWRGAYRAMGFPFLGDGRESLPEIQELNPVAGFYRLVQAASDDRAGLEKLPPSRGAAEIIGSLPFVSEHSQARLSALDNIARTVAQVPVFHLKFRKDASFWNAVEAERKVR